MAQHDYIIANQSGAAFRSDLNNGLAAIVSNNSGAAQPSTTYAYQWWADTTTGLLKIRNAANNAWITIGTLADANLGLLSLAGGTLTGALLVDDSGTAALPAIAFDGDTNTGIFSPGADQFGIATNGVERVEFGNTEVVFNDGGADVDFRVEGDTKPNLFKVDAGADTVIIDGLTHPSADGSAGQSLVTNGSGVLSVASVPPPGSIFWFAGNAAPAGYLKANGANVNRTFLCCFVCRHWHYLWSRQWQHYILPFLICAVSLLAAGMMGGALIVGEHSGQLRATLLQATLILTLPVAHQGIV
jgi:hypothetical protein